MYQTETLLRRKLRVRHPAGRGRMVLRSELDWERDDAAPTPRRPMTRGCWP